MLKVFSTGGNINICMLSDSAAVRLGIVEAVQRALGDQEVQSVVICGQNGLFCGGINMFTSPLQWKTKEMQT